MTLRPFIVSVIALAVLLVTTARTTPLPPAKAGLVDLTLLVAADFPGTWPKNDWPLFQMSHYLRIGPKSPYNSDVLLLEGNVGTQLDTPPHSIPMPGSGLPNAGPAGLLFAESVPPWQFVGEACVINLAHLRDRAAKGHSPLIQTSDIQAWEKKHRPLGPGDVVIFASGYSDAYYLPLPEGRRFIADPLEGRTPAWPDPTPEAMEYVAKRGVMAAATDSPSMGPIPDYADPTHTAGLKYGMIWTEGGTGFGQLPPTGALYGVLSPKYVGAMATESRALAVIGSPLAGQLIESARKKRVVDLSVMFADNLPLWWPGTGFGNHRQRLLTVRHAYDPKTEASHMVHIMDAHTGTHLVPPVYALPPPGFSNSSYSPEVQRWLAEYEKQFGPRGTSEVTVEKVPVSQTSGWLRVIDVRGLAGSSDRSKWPASPEIRSAHVAEYEKKNGALKPGEIVVFQTGHSQRCVPSEKDPKATGCLDDPVNGRSEGWPAPGPEVIVYLAGKGIRAVGIDAPTLGGVEPRRALMTYWALGSKGMAGIEYLTNLKQLPGKAYLLFAAIKVRDAHGSPGRALALY